VRLLTCTFSTSSLVSWAPRRRAAARLPVRVLTPCAHTSARASPAHPLWLQLGPLQNLFWGRADGFTPSCLGIWCGPLLSGSGFCRSSRRISVRGCWVAGSSDLQMTVAAEGPSALSGHRLLPTSCPCTHQALARAVCDPKG